MRRADIEPHIHQLNSRISDVLIWPVLPISLVASLALAYIYGFAFSPELQSAIFSSIMVYIILSPHLHSLIRFLKISFLFLSLCWLIFSQLYPFPLLHLLPFLCLCASGTFLLLAVRTLDHLRCRADAMIFLSLLCADLAMSSGQIAAASIRQAKHHLFLAETKLHGGELGERGVGKQGIGEQGIGVFARFFVYGLAYACLSSLPAMGRWVARGMMRAARALDRAEERLRGWQAGHAETGSGALPFLIVWICCLITPLRVTALNIATVLGGDEHKGVQYPIPPFLRNRPPNCGVVLVMFSQRTTLVRDGGGEHSYSPECLDGIGRDDDDGPRKGLPSTRALPGGEYGGNRESSPYP